MKILVIIVTYNGMRWIERCLNSTRHSSIALDVMVIDNGSSDGTKELIKNLYPEVIFVEPPHNIGFGKANNIGLQYVIDNDYEYAYLLNQDAWIFENTIENLVDANKSHNEFGILAPLMLMRDEKSLEPNFKRGLKICNIKCYSDYKNNKFTDDIYEVSSVMAAHWLMSRQTILTVGGFSPVFFQRGEDTNYIDRMHYHNLKIGIIPTAKSVHDMHDDAPESRKIYNVYVSNLVRLSNIYSVDTFRMCKTVLSSLKYSVVYKSKVPIVQLISIISKYHSLRNCREKSKRKCAFLDCNLSAKIKILSFGHIPTWAGGLQESGLANVIYQLAKHGSEFLEAEVTLVATDSYAPVRKDGKLMILGWTKVGLLYYIVCNPMRALKGLLHLRRLKKMYRVSESFLGLYFKRIFFEKCIRNVNPQIVHLHGVQAIWYLDLIPLQYKVVVTFHGMTGLDVNIPERVVLYNIEHDLFLSRRVDECYFICTQLVTIFKETYGDNGKRNLVIFNSYDNTQFFLDNNRLKSSRSDSEATVRKDEVTLCTVASLSDRKGQLRVLSGLSSLSDRKKIKYFCIGDDNLGYSEKLNKYAQENNLNFQYLGKMTPDDIRKHLYNADYMIMPSSSEGFGLSYLEAIACGVPVILPRNLPIAEERELINEKNSILLDDCSSESITKVLEQISKFDFKADEVAATMSSFSWNDISKQYIESFKEILREKTDTYWG